MQGRAGKCLDTHRDAQGHACDATQAVVSIQCELMAVEVSHLPKRNGKARQVNSCVILPWENPSGYQLPPSLLCDAVLGTSTITASPWLCQVMGAQGWASPLDDQGCFCPPSPYQELFVDLPCSHPLCLLG